MKKQIVIFFLVTGMLFSLTEAGQACDFCLLSQGISPLDTMKGSGIKISERYSVLDQIYSGTDKQLNQGVKEVHSTTELTGFYGITPDFMLLGVVPFKYGRTTGDPMPDGSPDTTMAGNASGLGDAALLARYSFLKKETPDTTTVMAALVGIKIPTGRTNARTADGMMYLDSHLQPGTGSTDYLLGLSFSHSLARFSVSANLLGTIPGSGKFGTTQHEFGNSLNYDVTAKYRLIPGEFSPMKPQLFAALGINGEARAREKEDHITVPDSGGNTVFLSPGLQLVLAPDWIADLSYQRAIYHNLYGTQLGDTYKVITAVTYLF